MPDQSSPQSVRLSVIYYVRKTMINMESILTIALQQYLTRTVTHIITVAIVITTRCKPRVNGAKYKLSSGEPD